MLPLPGKQRESRKALQEPQDLQKIDQCYIKSTFNYAGFVDLMHLSPRLEQCLTLCPVRASSEFGDSTLELSSVRRRVY